MYRTFIPESYAVTTKYKYIHCQQKFRIQHLLTHLKLLFYFHLNKQTSSCAVSASKIMYFSFISLKITFSIFYSSFSLPSSSSAESLSEGLSLVISLSSPELFLPDSSLRTSATNSSDFSFPDVWDMISDDELVSM